MHACKQKERALQLFITLPDYSIFIYWREQEEKGGEEKDGIIDALCDLYCYVSFKVYLCHFCTHISVELAICVFHRVRQPAKLCATQWLCWFPCRPCLCLALFYLKGYFKLILPWLSKRMLSQFCSFGDDLPYHGWLKTLNSLFSFWVLTCL